MSLHYSCRCGVLEMHFQTNSSLSAEEVACCQHCSCLWFLISLPYICQWFVGLRSADHAASYEYAEVRMRFMGVYCACPRQQLRLSKWQCVYFRRTGGKQRGLPLKPGTQMQSSRKSDISFSVCGVIVSATPVFLHMHVTFNPLRFWDDGNDCISSNLWLLSLPCSWNGTAWTNIRFPRLLQQLFFAYFYFQWPTFLHLIPAACYWTLHILSVIKYFLLWYAAKQCQFRTSSLQRCTLIYPSPLLHTLSDPFSLL